MIRTVLVAALASALLGVRALGQPALLGAPGNYSLAPEPPANALGPASGEASAFVGSHATSGAAIQLQSGLLGDAGLRGFAAFGTATGRDDPVVPGTQAARITTRSGAIGVEKSFLDGTTISIAGGWANASLSHGRYAPALLP